MLFIIHKAGELQQQLVKAAGIKLLTKSKQSFLCTQAGGGVVSLGAASFSNEWEKDVLLVTEADNIHGSSRKRP